MDRKAFKQRMQQLKEYREQNPGSNYLSFKSYKDGGEVKKDNTSIYRQEYQEPIPRTFTNNRKWEDLNKQEQLNIRQGKTEEGRPLEKGLEIVSPEFDIISGVRGIANMIPKAQTFYHGSPVKFDKFDTSFIGSGEGGSKAMKGINLWPDDSFRAAPKFANIRSSDAPLHLGRASKEIAGELNPTIYKVQGRGLNLYKGTTSKGLDQQDLVKQGYDGFTNNTQYTIFPESVNKLKIKQKYSIPEFINKNKDIDTWVPWSNDTEKMNTILDQVGSRAQRFEDGGETGTTPKTEPPYPSVYKGTRLNPYTGQPLSNGEAKPFLDLEDAANLTPIGDAITVKDMGQAASRKDWEGLGWASLGLVPFVPSTVSKIRRAIKGPVKPIIIPRSTPKVQKDLLVKKMQEAINARDTKALRYADDFYLKDEADAINARNQLVEQLSKDKRYYKRAKEADAKFGTEYEKTYNQIQNSNQQPNIKMDPDLGMNKHGRMDLDDEAAIDMVEGITPSPKDFTVSINPNGESSKGILDHEMSHFADALQSTNSTKPNPLGIPYYENSLINGSRNNSTFKDWSTYLNDNPDIPISEKDYNYLTRGTEEKAFINTMRTDMAHRGIIKKRTQDPTKKQLKQYLNLPDIDPSIVKLSKLYKDTVDGMYKATRTMPYLAGSGLTAYQAMKAQKEIYDENQNL